MPKRTKKNRYMKNGGDIITQSPPATAQGFAATAPAAPSTFSSFFDRAKKAVSSAASSAQTSVSSLTSALSPPPTGGKKCRKGGTSKSYFSLEKLASVVIPISTAKPQVWVGGKRSCRKRHKHTKSCKSKTYKKGNRKKRSRKSKFPFSESLKRLIKM